ncbi:sulfurtransferase TusA family protein [Caldovatus aquaticus]|uniref:Sulfurtransferase TusA family protein n=1 Tax=Caldovatus aquaticus TaxID=2865671 RepID=A0ABS7EYF3_9PROT|nr:sulfurtransferase TusA family protein [Caldovatus aquaticus]MBW8268376.1 sulfurtransferase TusA family protein [Caldovatus aquaticus]
MNCEISPGLKPEEEAADRRLDITGETCPMTFVRTRLELDRMQPGQLLLVLLRGAEPRENVPRAAAEQGHRVLALRDGEDGITRLLIRKAG